MTEVVRGRRRFVDRPPLTYHVARRVVAGQRLMQSASDVAIANFARRYADRVERDYGTFMQAVASGQIVARAAAANATK